MTISRFGHAGVMVADLAAAERYYTYVLGFSVMARYPADDEVLLGVGERDHLLLKGGAGSGWRSPYHVAFEVAEAHRGIAVMAERLEAQGIAFERVDHDGDPSLYWHDPDGHLLEACAAPGSAPRFAAPAERRAAARRFVYATARPVDRAIFACRFEAGPAAAVLSALAAHRNPDGGFGHALEPDVRCPASQPIHTLTALELLREAGIREPALADACAAFVSAVATADGGVPALLPGAQDYPAAAHWQGPAAFQPSLGWTVGLAAELAWHGAGHPWLARAIEAGRGHLERMEAEAHHLLYAMRFAATVLHGDERERMLAGLRRKLDDAALFVPETPVRRYGLTPLHYAPAPDAPAAAHFDRAQLVAHVADLLDAQQGDGGWPIRFAPPSAAASLEWRGRWTLEALGVLRAYGELP